MHKSAEENMEKKHAGAERKDVLQLKTNTKYTYVCIYMYVYTNIHVCIYKHTHTKSIGCLIFIGHFSQKSPRTSGSFAGNDLRLEASYGSSPSCKIYFPIHSQYVCIEHVVSRSTCFDCKIYFPIHSQFPVKYIFPFTLSLCVLNMSCQDLLALTVKYIFPFTLSFL